MSQVLNFQRILHDTGNINLHSLIVQQQKHHHNNPQPDIFFCHNRIKIANKISKAINTLGKSKQGNRVITGTRGIGKTLFFKKAAIALSTHSTLIPIYANYEKCIIAPSELLKSACQLQNIEIGDKSSKNIDSLIKAVTSQGKTFSLSKLTFLGRKPIFFIDEIQKLYSSSVSLINDILTEFSALIDNVNTRLFLIGNCDSLLPNSSTFPDLPKLNIKPTTMGPSSDTEIEDYLSKIFVK